MKVIIEVGFCGAKLDECHLLLGGEHDGAQIPLEGRKDHPPDDVVGVIDGLTQLRFDGTEREFFRHALVPMT